MYRPPPGALRWRRAASRDLTRLAGMMARLRRDETGLPGDPARAAMDLERALAAGAEATLFHGPGEDEPWAYALCEPRGGGTWIRHFFVEAAHRRRGVGRRALALLQEEVRPGSRFWEADVLPRNAAGRAFWAAAGFTETFVRVRREPGS